jgi:hypothetical protein
MTGKWFNDWHVVRGWHAVWHGTVTTASRVDRRRPPQVASAGQDGGLHPSLKKLRIIAAVQERLRRVPSIPPQPHDLFPPGTSSRDRPERVGILLAEQEAGVVENEVPA